MQRKIMLSMGALLLLAACADTDTRVHVPSSRVEFPNGVTVETGGRSGSPGHCPPGHHMKGWC